MAYSLRVAREKTYLRYKCRCRKCQHRHTFRRKRMHRLPACEMCGCKEWRIDYYRTSRAEARKRLCYCWQRCNPKFGHPYPHSYDKTRCTS